jgi:hypothetical protein
MSQADLLDWKLRQMQPENYYRMPPVGMTETRARIGSELRTQFTVRCGHEECWFVGHGATKPDAQITLDEHKCPTPPHRNELPTGRSTLQKMWDELDAATDALMGGASYNEFIGDQLKGYARGLAFTLSMFSHPYFRTMDEIVREALERRKMRNGTIPFRETPGYKYNPLPDQRVVGIVKTEPTTQRVPAKKTAPRVAPLTPGQINQIKTAKATGMFEDPNDIALICRVTVEQVKAVLAGGA